MIPLLVIAAFALASGAKSTVKTLQSLEFEIYGVKMLKSKSNPLNVYVELKLGLINPNDKVVSLDGGNIDVTYKNFSLAVLTLPQQASLGASATTPVTVQGRIKTVSAVLAIIASFTSGVGREVLLKGNIRAGGFNLPVNIKKSF